MCCISETGALSFSQKTMKYSTVTASFPSYFGRKAQNGFVPGDPRPFAQVPMLGS